MVLLVVLLMFLKFTHYDLSIYLSIYQVSTNPKTLLINCTASLEVPLLKVMNG